MLLAWWSFCGLEREHWSTRISKKVWNSLIHDLEGVNPVAVLCEELPQCLTHGVTIPFAKLFDRLGSGFG